MNLPIRWVCQPKRWPGSTAKWGVNDIENKKPAVKGLLRGNTDRVTPSGGVLLGSIDFDNGAA
jgi:hypothetical protein